MDNDEAIAIAKEELKAMGVDAHSVKDLLPEWYSLVEKPFSREGAIAVFKAIKFRNDQEGGAATTILWHGCEQTDDACQILIAFTLGLWMGQSQRAMLVRCEEDLDG